MMEWQLGAFTEFYRVFLYDYLNHGPVDLVVGAEDVAVQPKLFQVVQQLLLEDGLYRHQFQVVFQRAPLQPRPRRPQRFRLRHVLFVQLHLVLLQNAHRHFNLKKQNKNYSFFKLFHFKSRGFSYWNKD